MTETPTHTETETIDAEDEWATEQSDQQSDAPPTDQMNSQSDVSATAESSTDTGFDPGPETVQRYLMWGALGICSLLAVFALIQFYGSVTKTIDLWVDPKFQPMIHAAFNLAVLLLSLIGVSWLVRELK